MFNSFLKIITAFLIFLFVGIKYHPELNEAHFFIKHKPNFKLEYFRPISDSDVTLEELSNDHLAEELAYREYVGDFMDTDILDELAPFFIALMSYLFATGLLELLISKKRRKRNSPKRIITGYLGNLLLFFGSYAIFWNFHIKGIIIIALYFSGCIIFQYFVFKWKRKSRRKNKHNGRNNGNHHRKPIKNT
ncbi:hypothetical protein NBRC110019_16080 [Neptunitalea chrysea]|uniref:Uncharacterized protein n=1 Tax=Neptunitalea chrysea TaxID=1647581 RepID=A0A9W6EW83_9FLAO|nr:hypothetical protein [Neptunitalea chrysea]GLB52568.1 hypothetical protein NBRC110019_16080 [Neptunitalea chrysea]